MKKINLIKRLWTDSREKQSPQRFACYAAMLIMLLTIGVGQMWAGDAIYGNGKVIYFDVSNSNTDRWRYDQNNKSFKIKEYYWDAENELIDTRCCTRIGTSNVYYTTTNNDYVRYVQVLRCNSSCGDQNNYSNRVGCDIRSYNHDNCLYVPTGNANWWDTWVPAWTCYVPSMASATISKNASCVVYGGDGSSEKPYLVANSSSIVLDASATSVVTDDTAPTKEYKYWYKVNSGSRTQLRDYSSTSSYTFKASGTTGTTYEIEVEARNNNNSNYGANTATSSKIYFKTMAPIYAVLGEFNSWTASSTYNFSGSNATGYTASFTINKGSYTFKAVIDNGYYGNGQTYSRGSSSPSNTLSTDGGNMTITADVTGTYTFSFNFTAKTLSVTYPNKYTVTTGAYPSVAASAPTISPDLEDGYLAAGTSVTLTKQTANTGYTWKEWNSGSTGAGSSLGTGNTYTTTLSSDIAVYAIYTPNTYSVVFNKNHEDATGTMSDQAFTYAVAQNLTANVFVRNGYRFDGWATSSNGNVVYTDGQSVSDLTAEDGGTFDLYAHWTKSELTNIALTPTDYAVQDEQPTITATPTLSIPSGIGTTSICWGLYTNSECTSEVDGVSFSPNPSGGAGAVTFTAPDAAGTYYLKAIFRAGSTCEGTELSSFTKSFVVHPTHTVTIAAKVGETTIPADEYTPTNQTVNTYRADAVSAPDIAGYDFVNWTLGENMAKTDEELTANPIHITATADDNLTANYNYTDYVLTCPSGTGYTISGNPATVAYKATGSFTVVPAAGYTIAVTAADASGSVTLSKNGNLYSFVQGTSAVTITVTPTEVENTITIVNGHETGGDATEVTAKVASVTASATANAAAEGMKFAYWSISDAINLVDCETTDREIVFNASQSTTITANYTKRDKVTIHFAKPYGWTTVTAMFYQDATAKTGEIEAASTFTYEGATYYTFWYYTDDTGETDGDQSDQNNWNKVVFSNNGSDPLPSKTINNGYYYAKGAQEADGRTTPYAEWYLRGLLNGTDNWNSEHYARPFSVTDGTATFAFGSTKSGEQYYRIYRISTGEWFRYGSDKADLRISFDTPMTLIKNGDNADQFTSELGAYMFSMTNLNSDAPELTVSHPADTKYRLTSVTAGANGTLTGETGSITQLGRYMPTDISASANQGYRFKEWVTTGGVVVANPTSASTTATATADGTLTATFTNEGIVYLDKNAIRDAWTTTPYVYFYSSSYWDEDKGSGSKNILSGGHAMTQIGSTNIWYYDYSGDPGIDNTKNYIAFTNGNKSGQNNFDETSAIYRGDFYPAMNMFVPQNNITAYLNKHDSKQTAYYNSGYWMKYNDAEAGYYLRVYDGKGGNLQKVIPFVTANTSARDEYKAILHVDGSASAKFELCGYDIGTVNGVSYSGTFYSNTGTINSSQSGFSWEYTHGAAKASINFNAKGDYIYTLKCGTDGKLYVDVTFPIAIGDFCVVYNGLISTKADTKSDLYSDVIPHLTADGTRLDTVSFFVTKTNEAAKQPSLSLKKVTSINSTSGVITWDESDATFNAAVGTNITSLGSDVYVFKITQTKSGASYTLTYECLGEYDGNYYVRTDCAQGGWVAYKQDDHILKPTNYDGAGFNSYFVRYVPSGNVKFCIANQYNSQLTEQKLGDHNATDDGTLYDGANTRFEYDTTTNVVSRSYIGSSAANTFLYLRDASSGKMIYKTDGVTLLTNDTAKFKDQENWIYMLEVQAQPSATYQLEAKIHETTQYFDGTSSAKTLIGGSGDVKQNMRLVYDFKNNHLLKAWIPGTAVSGTVAIEADVMLLRTGHGDATQLNFATADSKLTDVKNVYGVIGFNKSDITDGEKTSTQRSLYWISFPFDVKLKDIFGFGKFGEDYIIRRYNGAKRAQIGWYAETNTFWETMNPNSEEEAESTMKAYEGYMIALDKGLFNSGDSRWKADGKDISAIYLYFPSSSTMDVLSQEDKEITLEELICNDDRPLSQDAGLPSPRTHRGTDSNWRVVGTGSLHDANITFRTLEGDPTTFNFYTWAANTNSLTPTAGADADAGSPTLFKAGHAVMIQWAGKLTWKAASVPAAIAARHRSSDYQNYNVELDLNYADEMVDRTYVILQENASAEFVLNEDLYKATNSNISNIYAYAGSYDCGISRVPIENTTVPVGVIIRKNGTYTFSMPSDFSGTATLIDTFTQTRTNLSMSDYEVTLNKGTINDRFLLEININKVTTAIDGVEGGSLKDGNAHKFIENGVMYILKDGVIFDARGNKVK